MVRLRAAERSDVAAIAKLEHQLFSDAWSESMLNGCLNQSHYAVTVCAGRVDTLADGNCTSDEAGVICEEQNLGSETVFGYLISTHVAGEAELLRIGVSPAFRRQGIGYLLMKAFAESCGERETPEAFLEVRVSNVPAISLYERFGFKTVGRRKNYYHQPDEDACLMAGTMGV